MNTVIWIWSLVLVVTRPVPQPGSYAERYPASRHPDNNVFLRLDERMRETGNVLPTPPLDRGQTPALKEMVLDMVAQNPCHSTRRFARELGVKHCAVHLILQDEDLYPQHYSRVQGLIPHDYHHCLEYCNWLLQEHERDPCFWSTSYGRMKQHSHMKVSSTVTTATCGHIIIPM
jgi:hypothetical protein